MVYILNCLLKGKRFFFARQIKIKANEKNKTTKNELKDREKKVDSSMICNTESFSSTWLVFREHFLVYFSFEVTSFIQFFKLF